MQKLIGWMEVSLAPRMNKINNNVWVQTLKDSMMQVLPMILVGSMVTIMGAFAEFLQSRPEGSTLQVIGSKIPNLWTVYNYTMGIVGLLVAFLVSFNYIERKKMHSLRLIAGMTSLALYALIVRMDTAEAFDFTALGAGGMFVAIVVGIASGLVFSLFGKFSFFSEDSSMPDFVRQWFDNMLPVSVLIFSTWVITYPLGFDIFAIINKALSPVMAFSETLVGFTLIYFLLCFFYSMGISTWMIYSLIQPIMLANIAANAQAVSKGLAATQINTSEVVFSGWMAIGGVGGTLFLCIMMLSAQSTRLRAIGKASLFPSILNINEPIVFGGVAWNPILMIPMWIHGLVAPVITYFWLKAGLATLPYGVFGFWYCPFPLSTWLVSPGMGGLLLLAIISVVNIAIYYPFFKVYDRQQVLVEAEKMAKKQKRAGVEGV